MKHLNPNTTAESGSIFTVLLGAVAIVSLLAMALQHLLSGPVASISRVTSHNEAVAQMSTISRIAIADAITQPSLGDCDTDTHVEPRPYRATTGNKPGNGGLIPTEFGTSTVDPWSSEYGYCVWDMGTLSAQAGCGGATGRLNGADSVTTGEAKSLTVLAVISAGPDRRFQTTCNAYTNGTTDVITTSGDDIVQRYTYMEAAAATADPWPP